MTGADAIRLEYLGWSGFRLLAPGGMELCVDPPPGTPFPLDRTANVLITHGHPEHVGGTQEQLRNPARSGSVQVAAATPVCRYLRKYASHAADRFQSCAPEQHFDFAGFGIDTFEWRHMPLLPPGIGAALRHLYRLASHPGCTARILLAGLRGPWPFPMLGFRVTHPAHGSILVYGEGLHRRTDPAEFDRVRNRFPADILLAAVEPEDVAVLPELIRRIGAPTVGLYQAHQPWREAFGMPQADLDALAAILAGQGKRSLIFRPGASEPDNNV